MWSRPLCRTTWTLVSPLTISTSLPFYIYCYSLSIRLWFFTWYLSPKALTSRHLSPSTSTFLKKKNHPSKRLLNTVLEFSKNWSHRSVEHSKIGKTRVFRSSSKPTPAVKSFGILSHLPLPYLQAMYLQMRPAMARTTTSLIFHLRISFQATDNTNAFSIIRATSPINLATIHRWTSPHAPGARAHDSTKIHDRSTGLTPLTSTLGCWCFLLMLVDPKINK